MRRHIGHGLLAGVLVAVTSCGSGEPETSPTLTVPVTLSPTGVTTTEPTSTTVGETTTGIKVSIPGSGSVVVITTPDDSERRVAEDISGVALCEPLAEAAPTVEQVQYLAQFVVQGRVASVKGPFWNQANGQEWSAETDEDSPSLYREIGLEVHRVVADSVDITDEEISFLVHGAGPTGSASCQDPWFEEGEHVLLFLNAQPWWQRDGGILSLMPYWGSLGVYKLVDGPQTTHAIPELDIRIPGQDMGSLNPSEYRTLDQFIDETTTTRNSPHPEWAAGEPTRDVVLETLEWYQNWIETGDMPITAFRICSMRSYGRRLTLLIAVALAVSAAPVSGFDHRTSIW